MALKIKLPQPVERYLAAEKAKDVDALAECFADNALVHDEAHDHRGREAIRKWKHEADTKYQFVVEPLDASVRENIVMVRARLTGNFPGSPVELDHKFTLANNKIASLEIG